MNTVLWIAAIWTALSFTCGVGFCWLLKRGTISFEAVEDDPNEFVHDWLERRV